MPIEMLVPIGIFVTGIIISAVASGYGIDLAAQRKKGG